jgi:hypothetical protein
MRSLCLERNANLESHFFWFEVDINFPGYVVLNKHDHIGVADVRYSEAQEGAFVIAYRWNGGQNQIWRMTPVT